MRTCSPTRSWMPCSGPRDWVTLGRTSGWAGRRTWESPACSSWSESWRWCGREGYRANNVDATVVAEAPKIGPLIPAMRKSLAAVLGVAETQVNLKGTTAKGMGALGAGEGIATFAVASVVRLRIRPRRADAKSPRRTK